MPVTEVKMFRTSDGDTFPLYQSACNHEFLSTAKRLIEAKIRESVDAQSALDWTPVEMADWIANHFSVLSDIEKEAIRSSLEVRK